MAKLDWMVNVNLFDNETGSFWRGPGMDPAKIKTEVFMLPCAASRWKRKAASPTAAAGCSGAIKAAKPLGRGRPDGDIMLALATRSRSLYKKEGGALPEPILNLKWDYANAHGDFDPPQGGQGRSTAISSRMSGPSADTGATRRGPWCRASSSSRMTARTSSGSWVYCGSYTETGNMAARRNQRTAERHRACTPNGPGPGRSTGGSSTTAPRWICRGTLEIPNGP